MIRWLRVVMPPWWAVAFATVPCLTLPLLIFALEWRIGAINFLPNEVEKFTLIFPGCAACLYGGYRVWAFHPALRPDYRRWLRGTPWTREKPLLLGPIHLVWQDLLIVALLVGVGWPRASWDSVIVVQVFLFMYLLVLGGVLAVTEAKLWAFAVGIGIGLMALFALDRWIFFAAATATYSVAYLGLRKSLSQFPWDNSLITQIPGLIVKPLGWPYDRLGPLPPERWPFTVLDAVLIGSLAAWWYFAINEQWRFSRREFGDDLNFLLLFVLSGGIIVRVAVYCFGYMPPINMLGRLVNGYWIIPGYDRVFVAPFVAALIGVLAFFTRLEGMLNPSVAPAIGLALVLCVLLGMGPSVREWRLTGHHRIVPIAPPTPKNR